MVIIVMGVAGAGKSTLAKALASALDWILIEGDDYHPIANVEKMGRAEALDDGDRAPWLEQLHRQIADLDGQGTSAVVACSALKAWRFQRDRAGMRGDSGLPISTPGPFSRWPPREM